MYTKKYQSLWPLAIFMGAFYIVDILRLYLENISNFHIDRIFTWVLPAFLFIHFILKKNPFEYLKLKKHIKEGIFWGIVISIIHAFIYCISRYLWNHTLAINFDLNFSTYWNVVLTAGIAEEIIFRGLVLQNLNEVFSFRISNIISSFLFVIAHIPYWYFGIPFRLPYDLFFLFFFGLLEGFFLRKTNSLWTCIIHHSVNNALVLIVK